MSRFFNHIGKEDLNLRRSTYSNPRDARYKRARINASIDVLPDECLFEIFRRLPGCAERSACGFVSKRWLSLLSSIHSTELRKNEFDEDDFLTRSLEGNEATDLRLCAIAVGIAPRGGLGKLIIRGSNPNPNPSRRVTSLGLTAIARCCPALKVLSLSNVSYIDDEGLVEIAKGCRNLRTLGLSECPLITDNALVAIANGCPDLISLKVDSCPNVGIEGLVAVGKNCPELEAVSIKHCPVSLVFSELGLQNLRSLTLSSCGVTDLDLEAIGRECPNLKAFSLIKFGSISDNGLISFSKVASLLETLILDECLRITELGFFGLLLNCGTNLKSVSISNCIGIDEMPFGFTLPESVAISLCSLTIRNCPLFGDVNLTLLSTICSQIQSLDLIDLVTISDYGVLPLIEACDAGLVNVKLSGSLNLTDITVSALTRTHGGTLERLHLSGCTGLTDSSLVAIANHCLLLNELDVSRCWISDLGLSSLSRSNQIAFSLRILSVEGCALLSDLCFLPFVKLGFSGLVSLNVQDCNGISNQAVGMIEQRLSNCDILS